MTISAPATLPVEVLAAIARATAELAPPERVYDTLRVQTERLLETDAFYLALWDETRQLIHFVAHHDGGVRLAPSETPLGNGPTSWVIRNRRSYRLHEGSDPVHEAANTFGDDRRSGSALHVPLLVGDRLVGVISAQAYRAGAYTADSQRLLEALAAHGAIALEVGRIARRTQELDHEVRRRLDQLDAVGQVAHLLATVDDAQRTMEAAAREGMKVFDATRCGLLLIDRATGRIEAPVSVGLSSRYLDAVAERFHQIPVAPVIMAGEAVFFEDMPSAPDSPVVKEAYAEGFRTLAVLPLVYLGETIGLLAYMHDAPHAWSPAERRVAATFADQAALAIGKSRLLDRVTQAKSEWQAVFDAAPSGLAVLDKNGRIQRANRWIADLAGVGVTELPGLELRVVTSEWPAGGSDPLERARSTGAPVTALLPGRRGRLLVLTVAPQEDGRAVAALDDVTEVVRTEARYRALFRAAPVAIVTLDREGRFQSVNDAATGLFGAEPAPRRLVDAVVPAERDHVQTVLAASFRGERRDFIFHVPQAGGGVREAQGVAVPVEERGGVATVLVLARDVTDEVELRERVGHSEKMAALGQLVSGVAHELNNPLAGIAALSQALLSDGSGDDGTDRVLHSIRGEAERAGRIVKDLLVFARQRPIERREVDLNAVVRSALAGPHVHPDRWRLDLAEALPPVTGDAEQLLQVVLNLVSNAEHAMAGAGEGTGTIRTWADDRWVGCEVLDPGAGIAPEVIGRIFEPFFTTKPAGQGTGLGLSISHGIIRAHRGEIRAQNRPEGGARLWFELPRGGAAAPR
ncbi:MAG TPA: GAF domain-containing protein [Gemmatimonadales bacterium]|nr:GAF domain-containing protein [Gemmatimonadales bacterium]